MEKRIQLWSCGGGRQSAGMAALMLEGRLRLPDHACMVAIEWEVKTTWEYLKSFILPAMDKLGVPFTLVPRKKYATRDLFGGATMDSPLLPMYTDKNGGAGKLNEWCSGEWKRDVAMRWAAEQPGWRDRGVDNWIGISWDEKHRRRSPQRKWIQPVYPLLDWFPQLMGVSSCLAAVERQGWTDPPRSRCCHCPNQLDAEWLQLTPKEFEIACEIEDEIRLIDPHAYLHSSMVPLREVQFVSSEKTSLFDGGGGGGCRSGMCY